MYNGSSLTVKNMPNRTNTNLRLVHCLFSSPSSFDTPGKISSLYGSHFNFLHLSRVLVKTSIHTASSLKQLKKIKMYIL